MGMPTDDPDYSVAINLETLDNQVKYCAITIKEQQFEKINKKNALFMTIWELENPIERKLQIFDPIKNYVQVTTKE